MADNPTRRFNLNSWAINLGITAVVIVSMFAMCQGSDVNANDAASSSTAPASTSNTNTAGANTASESSAPSAPAPASGTLERETSQSATERRFSPQTSRQSDQAPTNQETITPNNTGGGPLPSANRNFQSVPNPQPAPNPYFDRNVTPQQREQLRQDRQQIDSNPYENETRRTQREGVEQLAPEREQLQDDQQQLDRDPYEDENRQIQLDEQDELAPEREQLQDDQQQLDRDPYEDENRQIQLDEQDELAPERQQLQDEREQLDSNPYEDENRQIQSEERDPINQESQLFQRDENGQLIDDRTQINDLDNLDNDGQYPQENYYERLLPYDIITYSQFLQSDYPDESFDNIPSYALVADGIRHLAAALFTLSEQNDSAPNSREQSLNNLNDLADQLQNNSTDFDASEITSTAFVEITNWMRQIGDNSFPFSRGTEEINDVEDAAQKIEGNRPMQDQQYDVRRFFYLAEIAVHALVE